MRIERYLQDSAARDGARTAIIAGETRLSYARFLDLSTRMAATLHANGIGRGDRVLILLDNDWQAAVTIFATWIAGAMICPVNPSSKSARLVQIARDCRPALMVVEGRLLSVVQGLPELADIPRLVTGDTGSFDAALQVEPLAAETHPATDLAALIYTSGSTGEPKGVMLAHDNMDAAARSITAYLENTATDVILVVLPLSFGYGLSQLVTAMRVGATLVIEKSFAFPQTVFENIRDERVTGFPLVPTMAAMMLRARELDPSYFASLRYMTSAAAPLPLAHLDGLRAFLPQARLYVMYGQTECTRVSWLPPEEIDTRRGSVGIAIPGTHAEVVDEAGNALPPSTVGELVISGPHVMRGYWQNEAATRQALRPDPHTGALRLHTGDLFTADADGYLTFVARMDDIIKSRGEKVAPKAVEDVLCRMPGIAEALVVGVPDDVLGQVVKAVVVTTDPALTDRDVMRFCARNLEDHMVPKLVEFRDSLPKTDSGKASRRLAAEPDNTTGSRMTTPKPHTSAFAPLVLDAAGEVERITRWLREELRTGLRKRGLVLGISGGIDSSLCAALAVRALGAKNVFALFMPENDSDPESLRLGRSVAETFGIESIVEDIGPSLAAMGCYERRDAFIREAVPEFRAGWGSKIVFDNPMTTGGYNISSLVVRAPDGEMRKVRLSASAYLGIVAATNMKQRTRKQLEYYHADRLNFAVIGTPNRLEYDQGFFVKNGDGAADIKPIAHLYKSQVYQLAAHLGVPAEILSRPPTTDTYSLPQTQEEFYFALPYDKMDICLYGLEHALPVATVAAATGLKDGEVELVWADIAAKRKVARYLHCQPLVMAGTP